MNELNEQISTVKTPQEAVDQFVGEQFIEWLTDYVRHKTESWPSLKLLALTEAKPEKIRKIMIQRYLALAALWGSEGDPGFLRFAIGNLSESNDPEAEAPLELLEKKLQEPQSFVGSWKNILRQMGANDEEISRTKAKEFTRTYIAELSDVYSTQDWETAVGAMASLEWSLAYELPVWTTVLTRNKIDAAKDMENLSAVSDAKTIIETGHLLDKIVFDPATKQLVWSGVSRQLDLKQQFLDELIKLLD